jgi:hypothetical protein
MISYIAHLPLTNCTTNEYGQLQPMDEHMITYSNWCMFFVCLSKSILECTHIMWKTICHELSRRGIFYHLHIHKTLLQQINDKYPPTLQQPIHGKLQYVTMLFVIE